MIRLKTLLMETKADVMEKAAGIASRMGEQIETQLGAGYYGIAYLLRSGKVMKITPDIKEVAAASRYRTKQRVPHIVSVYDVRKIEQFSETQYYVIIMDYVTPFTEAEIKVWAAIYKDYFNERFNDEITQEECEDIMDQLGPLQLPADWLDRVMAQRQSVLAAFRRNQVYTNEAHQYNMGWSRNGKLVHFDWWMRLDSEHDRWQQFQTQPRRLNKPVRYDATGIDTPGDPTM